MARGTRSHILRSKSNQLVHRLSHHRRDHSPLHRLKKEHLSFIQYSLALSLKFGLDKKMLSDGNKKLEAELKAAKNEIEKYEENKKAIQNEKQNLMQENKDLKEQLTKLQRDYQTLQTEKQKTVDLTMIWKS